ncbi:isoprenylcysteine carboxylmethyltransferase family protein [Paraburkholderia agricolaris]|uniref:Isoprenylcysteine carboxylmethyltransferase family protein n=1 Tax=Paraburkholderia agricolaris TaxID=2152888 RepID=A0ABW8ZN31_9BURK
MNIVFIIVFLAWVGSEMVLSSILRAKQEEETHRDQKTLLTIWITTVAAIAVAGLVARICSLPIVPGARFLYAGLMVIVMGMMLRIGSIVVLGRFFTYNVAIREGHTLITVGPYRYLRHPAYTGLLVSFFGYGLALNNWASLAIAFFPVLIAMSKRIGVEEAVLTQQFGEAYVQYKRRSWALFPWIY